MPHIHTEPGQADATASAYVILRDGGEPKVLLHKHKKFNVLLPPGGHIELNESPWAAVSHELTEEAGYTLDDLTVLQPAVRIAPHHEVVMHPQPLFMNTHHVPPSHYHSDTAYLFVADAQPKLKPDEGESQDLRWCTRAEVAALSRDELWEHVRLIILAIFDDFLDEWQALPATSFSTSIHPEKTVYEQ